MSKPKEGTGTDGSADLAPDAKKREPATRGNAVSRKEQSGQHCESADDGKAVDATAPSSEKDKSAQPGGAPAEDDDSDKSGKLLSIVTRLLLSLISPRAEKCAGSLEELRVNLPKTRWSGLLFVMITLGIVAVCALPFLFPLLSGLVIPPVHPSKGEQCYLTDMMNLLPFDEKPDGQRDKFRKQAVDKADTETKSWLKVRELVTVFFEVPVKELKDPNQWTQEEKDSWPGFIKIQLISYDPDAKGVTPISALFSPSVGSAAKCVRKVYVLHDHEDYNLRGEPLDTGYKDGHVFSPLLQPGDQVLIVVSYQGWLVGGPLHEPTPDYRCDWHMVEVSDYATKGPVSYLFATGSTNYEISSLKGYDFGNNNDKQLIFEKHTEPPSRALSSDLEKRLNLAIKAIQKKGDFAELPYSKAFEFLASRDSDKGFSKVTWIGEQRKAQSRDTAYITQTNCENRPCK